MAFAQGKVTSYTTWDDNYFYAAFFVEDPDIRGVNTKPFSKPTEDDSVEIFIETDNKHQSGRSAKSFSMAVSAAGGAAFTVGGTDGKRSPKQIMTFKYVSTIDGSINNSEDQDVGYTVELALPWFEMGVAAPTPGQMMSFNVVIRMKGDTDKFVSLSPRVKTEGDIDDASKWVDLVFTGPVFGAATLSNEKIVSSRYITRVPLVDGRLRDSEWNKNTSFKFELPIEARKGPINQFQKMLLTYYFYWYQGNPRKAAPFAHVRDADGKSQLTDQPIRGAGPWFSYDRVQWHKDELSDIKRAGIDIVLPVYWGDQANRTGFAAKGLDCMAEALRELKTENKPYPMVGMFFDTTAMSVAYGSKPDMVSDEAKQTFYGMVRDFFMRVPEEFLAQVQMADERSARPCYVIELYTSSFLGQVDASLISYVNTRFAEEFDANLLWLGPTDYKGKIDGFDGYCNYGAGLGFFYDDTAKVRIAAVGPGYDDCAVPGRNTPIRSRDGGDTYASDWGKALDKRPNWIVVDAWNELHEGSDVCGSREYGFTYVDSTALQALKFRGPRDYDAKYLRQNMPKVIRPDTFCQVDLLIQNDGAKPWKAAEGYALSYRWYKDGRPVGESAIRRPIIKDILPGHSAEIAIGVAAVTSGNVKVPAGKYDIRFEMVRLADEKWFSSLGDEPFTVPVEVGSPDGNRARFLTVNGTGLVKTGVTYPYKLRVRNDGSETWKAATVQVGCRLFKVASYVHNGPADLREEVPITAVRANLIKDVAPGEAAEVLVPVCLKDASGQPIPAWKQSDPWSYQLQFDIWDGAKWLSDAGSRPCDRIVDVFDSDPSVRITAADVPDAVDAGKSYDVKIIVRNGGAAPLSPKTCAFGYHWYYLDGIEAVWDGEKTPIKTPIGPGEPAVVVARLTAPPYDGRYILVWDAVVDGKWASTEEIERGGNTLIDEVTVHNGKLEFADLSKLYDTVGTSPERNRPSGDFDGTGLSFPSEAMPPDVGLGKSNDLYPSGYEWKAAGTGLESSRHISFRFGPKQPGDKNTITCAGQTIAIPKGSYSRVHILAASVASDQEAEFGLQSQSGVKSAKLTLSDWSDEPKHGEEAGFVALHRHSLSGDQRGAKCYLFHYTIDVDRAQPLTGIILPKNDKVRVVAVTLERP